MLQQYVGRIARSTKFYCKKEDGFATRPLLFSGNEQK